MGLHARLFDELAQQQTLFTIGLKADWVIEQLPPETALIHPLRSIKQLASLGTAQVHDAIFALSMTELQEGGRVSVLYSRIRDLREATSIEADLVVSELVVSIPARIENALLLARRPMRSRHSD